MTVSHNNTCNKNTNTQKLFCFPTLPAGTSLVKDTRVVKNDKIAYNNSHKPAVWVSVTKPIGIIGKPQADRMPLNNRFQILAYLQTNSNESFVDKLSTKSASSSLRTHGSNTTKIATACDNKTVASKDNIQTSVPMPPEK